MSNQPKTGKNEKKPETEIVLNKEQQEQFDIIMSIGEEVIKPIELKKLIKFKTEVQKQPIISYDGFEPSGRIHIAQGIMKMINVNKLIKAGCHVKLLVADWFALMNNKVGGDINKIRTVGKYMIEVWKSSGMDTSKVDFIWSSEVINKSASDYWSLVLDIARRNTVTRITRCSQIMGRSDKEELSAGQIFYPCMQCADIFHLKADICQLGMDQRKVNMLAREYCDLIKRKHKPVIVSHHMIMGLTGKKMSKSDPMAAIFMEDTESEVSLKIKKAYCKPGDIELNPLLEYIKYIILPLENKFTIKRKTENGGDVEYTEFEKMEEDFKNLKLHPGDLKPAVAKAINRILTPCRKHFKENKEAKQLLSKVKGYIKQMKKKKEKEEKEKLKKKEKEEKDNKKSE